MAFVPRTFDQILEDMVSHVQSNTVVSDFSVGSVVRTILEAAALEDDEQYFQMVQLLEAFRFTTARGEDLDRRLADFGLVRREATTATCRVRFFNSNLVSDQISLEDAAGVSTIQVFSSVKFPTTGYPYSLRIGEGTTRIQDVAVTNNNTATNTLTLSSPLVSGVEIGDRVSLITGTSAYTINSGTAIQAAPTVSEPARLYTTQEPAFIVQGNFFSNEVLVKAQQPGAVGNVGAQRITQFVSSPPFPGGGVINLVSASGGLPRESDREFRENALRQLQSLSRGTPLALQSAAVRVTDPITGQRAISANVVENFTDNEVVLYIDDGTGLTPDTIPLADGSLNTGGGALAIGSGTAVLASTEAFPSSGTVLIESDSSGHPAELIEYDSKDDSTNTLNFATLTTTLHDDGTSVLFVDEITDSAESGRRRFKLQNPPVVRGTDRIFLNPGSGWTELTPEVDYVLNKGTGEFQLTDPGGVAAGARMVANYDFYTNLIAEVQRVIEGDPSDFSTYPGVKAAGVFVSVEAPVIKRVQVIVSIAAATGFREEDLVEAVRQQIETYVSSLRLGEDVIRARIIDVAYNVQGVKDVYITLPSSNVAVLENELPVPFDSSGNTLVTVL